MIISTGGTGLTGRDVTVEAMRGLFEKEIEGFSVAFHMISFKKIGISTVQSRATAGVAKGKYIFCLPGSPGACRDGWDEILKAQLDYRHMPCNFVEIMPRLDEHLRKKGRLARPSVLDLFTGERIFSPMATLIDKRSTALRHSARAAR